MKPIAACKSVWLKGCVKGCDSAKPRRKRMINKQDLSRAIVGERREEKRRRECWWKVGTCVNK